MDEVDKILEANRSVHDTFAQFHDRRASHIIKKDRKIFYERLLSHLLEKEGVELKNLAVLEFGCGTGNFAPFFFSRGIRSYTGIDISEKMIQIAKEKAKIFEGVDFFIGSAEEFLRRAKSDKQQFDFVFSFSFLHHLFAPNKFLSQVKEIIAPGGAYIALHEPNQETQKINNVLAKIDNVLAYFMGYNSVDPSTLRIKKIFAAIRRRLKSIFSRENKPREQKIDYVDYQLNSGKFSPLLFRRQDIKTGYYSYFTYGFLERISGAINNYFYLILRKYR